MRKNLILIGQFGAAHGVKGHVRVKSFASDPGAIANYALTDATGLKSFVFTELRPVKGEMFVGKLKGVDDRKTAESLTHAGLFLARETLPEPEEGEFYLSDLIGLEAIGLDGEPVGRVNNVLNFGGGDILEILPRDGGESKLYAFTKANVPEIDLKAGRITLVPPAESEAGGPEALDGPEAC